ncbi:MAG: serpin family protein [Bacteroidales bacterium]|nr:serpin family protein [Bacteroidales bacterium]
MKTNSRLLMIMAALTAMYACGPQYQKPTEGSDIGFALSYFQKVNQTVKYDENLIVSPYSAGVALSMLAEGAEGQTKAEFADALNGCLFKAEDLGGGDSLTVKSANSIWVDDNFSLRNRYVGLLEKDFDAFITTQNFADPATVKAINNWCAENTEGKITEIIDELGRGTVMVLMNALYFNAPWEYAFDPAQTADKVFHAISGDREVPMMTRKARFMYAEYQGCQMVRLPYSGERYAMYIVLPPAGMDVNSVIPYISESAYESAMGMLSAGEVIVELPKFKLEASLLLNDALEKMGIRTAFGGAADFSGISAMGPLALSQVKQKCYIDVSEKGTEAAAVTSAQVRLTSVAPTRVRRVTVDRPFLFFIADTEKDNILFAGKIVDL